MRRSPEQIADSDREKERAGGGDRVTEYEVNVGQGNRRKGRRKNKRVLKCVTINAQSLKNKMDELRSDDFMDRKYHIISITESWGNKDIPDATYELKGYRMYRRDRDGAQGGGHNSVCENGNRTEGM